MRLYCSDAMDKMLADFNPRTPYGMRPNSVWIMNRETNFNPRTPYGMRLNGTGTGQGTGLISIHAPLTGCDGGLMDFLGV